VLGAFGFGTAAAAVITTYGGRGRERRTVRSRALDCLEEIEIKRRVHPLGGSASYERKAFTALCAKCMIAGMLRHVVSVYDHVCEADSSLAPAKNPDDFKGESCQKLAQGTYSDRQGPEASPPMTVSGIHFLQR
jgi:hypothetical protein